MVVQHNLTAMNSNRMLGLTTATQAKSTEKLSSGYKINRAADDAAGLAISEKMRKQIRGLTQASANAQDGISAVQTAEGALAEVQDMLQRMNELAVKAANGTESESDRAAIQSEIDQLTTEIDRVAETTKFNETYLLKGDKDPSAIKGYVFSYGIVKTAKAPTIDMNGDEGTEGTNDGTGITLDVALETGSKATAEDMNTLLKSIRDQGISVTATSEWDAVEEEAKDTVYSISLNGDAATKFEVVTVNAAAGTFAIQDKAGNKMATLTADDYARTATKGNNAVDTVTISAFSATAMDKAKDRMAFYDKDGNKISENALENYVGVDATGKPLQKAEAKLYDALGNEVELADYTTAVTAVQNKPAALRFSLHVGADATRNNQITLNIDSMSAKGLGVVGIRVDGMDDTNALSAIETIKAALAKVSAQRSDLGAIQNRLEHTINNLDNVVENTTSAESEIRDTDMASEMVKYSNNNILAQAGQAMLAQANQSNQGVLSLLG